MKPHEMDYAQVDAWNYKDMPEGLACEAGSSARYVTGGWRAMRPVWNEGACKNCMLCWIACPDVSILVEDGRMTGIDYDHCKGCGICIHECAFGALELIREDQAKEA
ncbi:MAG: 4Fe-4S binding protein [Coriobacteriia bacterium]|nr:4Fe-4S binding protein [Coriobacteriia bacterium]